jgi:integrase
VKIKRSQINAGVISLKQQKTGAEVVIPVSAPLLRSARATTARGIYLLTDKQGRPLPASRLSKIMAQAISDAGLPNRCVAHGLRKALLRRLAEAGATTKQIASVTGHHTL